MYVFDKPTLQQEKPHLWKLFLSVFSLLSHQWGEYMPLLWLSGTVKEAESLSSCLTHPPSVLLPFEEKKKEREKEKGGGVG